MIQTPINTATAERYLSDHSGRGPSLAGVGIQRPAASFDGGLVV